MAPAASAATFLRCQVCTCLLGKADNTTAGVCLDCADRPEGRRLLRPTAVARPGTAPARGRAAGSASTATAFSAADRSLIKNIGSSLPAAELLELLNTRLGADRPAAALYTLGQLQAELESSAAPDTGWASLRRALAAARSDGTLALITGQVVDDFALVFRLTPNQITHLRDVIASAKDA